MGRVKRSTFRAAAGALAAVVVAAAGTAPLTGAGEIAISMDAGRVTLIATEARLADVLAEWSRVGQTQFVGAGPIGGDLITLHLVDAAEAEAIHFLLGAAAGYVAAPRRAGGVGVSRYDRVTIMATRGTPLRPVRPTAPLRGGGVPVEAPPAYDPVRTSPDAPGLVRNGRAAAAARRRRCRSGEPTARHRARGRSGGDDAVPGHRLGSRRVAVAGALAPRTSAAVTVRPPRRARWRRR